MTNLKTRETWKNNLIRIGLILSIPQLLGANCAGLPPKWDVDFWAGSHSSKNPGTNNQGAFVRCIEESQDGKTCTTWAYIYADNPMIDEYIAIHKTAIQKLYDDVLSKCEKWSGQPSFDIIKK